MQTFSCRFQTVLQKNMTTGAATFTVRTQDQTLPLNQYGTVTCKGEIRNYPKNTPLTLTGEVTDEIFYVTVCEEGSDQKEDAIAFLTGGLFPGVGRKTAEKIMNALGDNLFAGVRDDNAREKLEQAGIRPEIIRQIADMVKAFSGMDEILNFIRGFGGSYMDAYLLHRSYGAGAVEMIRKHPYIAATSGTAYDVCERIARDSGVAYYDHDRIKALLHETLRQNDQMGNTAMILNDLVKAAGRIENSAGCGYRTPAYFLCGNLLCDEFGIWEQDGTWYVQESARADQERQAALKIHYLRDSNLCIPTEESRINRIESDFGVHYSAEQRAAFRLLEYPGVKILTGGPGTGKTTVLHGLIRYYRETRRDNILLCSPTAAAAQRMREATGYPAETVHRALGLLAGGRKARENRKCLEKGLVIVDEVSMLDTEIFSILLQQTLPGSTLLLVGDEEQLESVGAGCVLSDLLSDPSIPAVRLKTVYRQEDTSSILSNGLKIRGGHPEISTDDDSRLFPVRTDRELTETALRLAELLYDRDDPYRMRLLTPVRSIKYLYGVEALNRELQKRLNPARENTLVCGENEFHIGDPVQMTKNNYGEGYINGDLGVITALSAYGGGKMTIHMEGKEDEIEVEGGSLADVALAYAQTVHKAQGGECDTCIIILPEKPKAMLYRKILYVAATRAKKKNIFVVQNGALKTAVSNAVRNTRITGLPHQLSEVLNRERE